MDEITLEGFESLDVGVIEVVERMCKHSLEEISPALKDAVLRLRKSGKTFDLALEATQKGKTVVKKYSHANLFMAVHGLFNTSFG